MEDTSLDEFLDGEGENDSTCEKDESSGERRDDSASGEEENREPDVPGDVAVTAVTARVVPEGGQCQACSESVTRLYDDDGTFVCGSCKDW